jgi:NAD(P)-dependent dehydrogenase (short-subunit alcohol dehydrogenase family)
MRAIIIGATGTIGREVVKVFRNNGYEVTEASRNSHTKVDIENPESVERLLKESGPVDAIVSAAGYAAMGNIKSLTIEDFTKSWNSKLLGQILLAQKGLMYLNRGGTILLTGGIFAWQPVPGSSAIAMVNSALEGFARAVALETDEGKKVLVIHPPLVAETASLIGMDPTPFPSAHEVARAYMDAVTTGKPGIPFFYGSDRPQEMEF